MSNIDLIPRILLSETTAKELAPQLTEIFGANGYRHVSAKEIHAGTADADLCFVSINFRSLVVVRVWFALIAYHIPVIP